MPSARPRVVVPVPPVVPVRLTERLLVSGLTIKDDIQKAFESWETNFRDPVKHALMSMPATDEGEVQAVTFGGVKVYLAKTFPKSSWDNPRLAISLSRGIQGGAIELRDLHTLLDSGAITIAKPDQVAQLLATRVHVNATSFVIQPEHPDVPSRVDLKWGAVPGAQPLVGPLQDLPDRVAVAAASALGGDRTVARPEGAIQRAADIDRANAAAIVVPPLVVAPPVRALPAGTVAVRRTPHGDAITQLETEVAPTPRLRRRRRTR